MITEIYRRILQALGLFLLQLLVFSHIHLWGYATPLVFISLLLYVPSNSPQTPTLLVSFMLGLMVDIIHSTPGVGAASMTLMAVLQPTLLRMFAPRDAGEVITPSFASMGTLCHIRFVSALLGIFHIVYFTLDCFSFNHFWEFLLYVLLSYVLTLVIVLGMEELRTRIKN